MMERRPRAPVLRLIAFLTMAPSASSATVIPPSRTAVILLDKRVLGLGQDGLERGLVEILKRRHDRKAAEVFEQVFRLYVAKDLALLSILGRPDLGAEAEWRTVTCRRPAAGCEVSNRPPFAALQFVVSWYFIGWLSSASDQSVRRARDRATSHRAPSRAGSVPERQQPCSACARQTETLQLRRVHRGTRGLTGVRCVPSWSKDRPLHAR
jgi:hypothetical protein